MNSEVAKIIDIGKRLYSRGFCPGTSGNISFRVKDRIYITSSGSCLGELEEDDVLVCALDGNLIEGNKKISSESKMHFLVYSARPDIDAIVHAHPPKATAFGIAGVPLDKPILAEAYFWLGSVPIAEYALPSTDVLAQSVVDALKTHDAVLMANHGVTVIGQDLKHTFFKFETLELYADMYLNTKILGKANILNEEQLSEIDELRKKMLHS